MLALAPEPYPTRRAAWTLVGTLFLASILGSIDRSALSFLIEPIRRDLKISDVEFSLLQGFAFSIVYVVAGIPLGLVADKVVRARLLAGGIALWSAATIMGGLAPDFYWMFASRMLVGMGEATLGVCAMSLISDSFSQGARGLPISIHQLGGAIAAGLAAFLLTWVLRGVPLGQFDFVPGVRGAAPWRVALVLMGAAGLPVAALIAAQREPARRGVAIRTGGTGLRNCLTYLSDNAGFFFWLYGGFGLFSIATYGIVAWAAAMLGRQYGLDPAHVSRAFGTSFLIAGACGALLSGLLLDSRAFKRLRLATLSLLTFAPMIALPAAMASLSPTSGWAAMMLATVIAAGPVVSVSMLNTLSQTMPNDMRGFSVSILSLAGSLIGSILGPLLIACYTQYVLGDDRLVGNAVLIVTTPALLLASLCYAQARTHLNRRLAAGDGLATVMAVDREQAGTIGDGNGGC